MVGKYARGLETEMKILEQLALNKEAYQYNLKANIKPASSYRTVLRTLRTLKEDGLANLVRKEPSEKQGKERNIWSISLKGLLTLLVQNEDIWRQIDLVVETHENLLLIFEKWQFFKSQGIDTDIAISLRIALVAITTAQLNLQAGFSKSMKWTEEELRELTDSMALGVYELRTSKKPSSFYLKILDVCKKDRDLTKFIVNELMQFKKVTEEHVTRLESALKMFE